MAIVPHDLQRVGRRGHLIWVHVLGDLVGVHETLVGGLTEAACARTVVSEPEVQAVHDVSTGPCSPTTLFIECQETPGDTRRHFGVEINTHYSCVLPSPVVMVTTSEPLAADEIVNVDIGQSQKNPNHDAPQRIPSSLTVQQGKQQVQQGETRESHDPSLPHRKRCVPPPFIPKASE